MILFEMSEFYEKATDIIAIVFASIVIAIFLMGIVMTIIADLKTISMKKEFKKQLENEHDKALIMEYENTKYTYFKKKGKKQ